MVAFSRSAGVCALLLASTANAAVDLVRGQSTADATSERRALLTYAAGVGKVAIDDRRILAATKEAQKMVVEAVGKQNPELGERASELLGTAQETEREVLANELHEMHQALRVAHKPEERGHRTEGHSSMLESRAASEQGARTGKILHEIGMVEHRVAKVMRGDPEALHREEELLHDAAAMARQAGRAGMRFHELRREEAARTKDAASESHAGLKHQHHHRHHHEPDAPVDDQAALRRYASSMAKVASSDRHILSEAQEAEEALQKLAQENPAVSEQAAMLLGHAKAEQHKLLAEERRDVMEARSRLGPRGLHAGGSVESVKMEAKKLRARAHRAHKVLKKHSQLVKGEAKLARRCKHLLAELSEVHEDAEEALEDGDAVDAQAVQIVGGFLDHAQHVLKQVATLHQQVSERAARSAHRSELVAEKAQTETGSHQELLRGEHRLVHEMERAEKAVQRLVRGAGASKVRSMVTRMLERAKSAEKSAIATQNRQALRGLHDAE